MEITGNRPAGSNPTNNEETPTGAPPPTSKKSPSTEDAFVSMLAGSYFEQMNMNKALFDPVKDAIDEGKDE